MFAPPFVELTDGTAIRACTDLIQRSELPFGKYPKDYNLQRIASWNELEGHPIAHPCEILIEFETLKQSTE
jgi:hypothetical protein